ncbi:hypothetical protein TD95_003778 [Thielaviopsis punctulata]|uniref:Zinc-ribbon 15 domain-containing protein n=1 Tax=Thielaviopsis punctulata TaxID=72032 RepID=A0A0F4ZH77_9PEZI|nr:hypothetical protein TD95_003778 [Thielaviopsis punctulata]
MFFFFTFGEHTFRKEVSDYRGVVCQCHNCGNMSGRVLKSNPWFTFCFVPVIPLSLKGYTDISCHICNFAQPLANRPDVQAMIGGGGNPGAVPMPQYQGNQGWQQQGQQAYAAGANQGHHAQYVQNQTGYPAQQGSKPPGQYQ